MIDKAEENCGSSSILLSHALRAKKNIDMLTYDPKKEAGKTTIHQFDFIK